MRTLRFGRAPLGAVLIAASLLSACGGGSGSSDRDIDRNDPPKTGGHLNPPQTGSMTMFCVDGDQFQCSGSDIIRTDNGIALTSSGVQTYARSTSDLQASNPEKTTAYGMAPAAGGIAEVRLAKDDAGVVSQPRLLLRNLDIKWNGRDERPPVIETFHTAQARVQLDAKGAVVFSPLPPPSDYGYYDFALKGVNATQANYGNNIYFPRSPDNPPRCASCPNYESTGPQFRKGDWRAGGQNPDATSAVRLHGDGDIHAGNGLPDANGNPTILPGGSGIGVPFPGSKGWRGLDNWSYRYSNLATWVTQDTVSIVEWAPGSDEHSKIRRGVVTFGDVTRPADVPASGMATYSGIAYGWYISDGSTTKFPAFFRATARISVNFATREVSVALQNAFENSEAMTALPAVDFQAVTRMGAADAQNNYFTGTVDNGAMSGGISGRYFGPVASGGSGTGPAELGGAFSLSNSSTKAALVGGFITLRK